MSNLQQNDEVFAIVVTYNRKELLEENIKALLNQTYNSLKILIVDNASSDGTNELVKKYLSDKLLYVNTGSNLGGAGGFNYGIKFGYENFKSKYFWIMDDDTIPNKDALENLLKAKDTLNNDFGFLSSKTLWIDNNICNMNIQNFVSNILDKAEYIENGLLEIESATFVSCFIKREIVKEVGLPIKEFFIWNDDIEYTRRISKKYTSYFVNNSVVVHKMKNNTLATNFEEVDKNRVDRLFYNYRNKFYIDKQNGIKGFFKGALRCIKYCFLYLVKGKLKFRAIKAIAKALILGMFFNPKIEYVNDGRQKCGK